MSEPNALAPGDAVVALRSLPRRFNELLDRAAQEGHPELVPPILGRAEAGASAIAAAGEDLHRILVTATPESDGNGSDDPLARLRQAVNRVAAEAQAASGKDWTRTGPRAERTVTALDVLNEAVRAGVDELRAAQAMLPTADD